MTLSRDYEFARIAVRITSGQVCETLEHIPIRRLHDGVPPLDVMLRAARALVTDDVDPPADALPPMELLNEHAGLSDPVMTLLGGLHPAWGLTEVSWRTAIGRLYYLDIPIEEIATKWKFLRNIAWSYRGDILRHAFTLTDHQREAVNAANAARLANARELEREIIMEAFFDATEAEEEGEADDAATSQAHAV